MQTADQISQLIQRIHQGERLKYVFFWGHQPKKDGSIGKTCFSQWFESSFSLNGISYLTAEHYMMAEKARLFDDQDALNQISASKTPALAKKLGRGIIGFDVGMTVRFEAGRMRAYYTSLDGSPREISYRSTFKQARRTVAKPIVSRSTGKTVYWEHKAVYLRFEQFGNAWALTLLPGYVFTLDSETRPIASEKIGPLSTRRAARDYNPTVLHDLVFWSRMLADGHDDSSFRLHLTRQPSGPFVDVASTIPTFVFQDSLEMSDSEGKEIDSPTDLGEDSEDLQEQIERIVAEETNETTQDEDSDR